MFPKWQKKRPVPESFGIFLNDLELVVFFMPVEELEEHDPLIIALEDVSLTYSEMSPVFSSKTCFFLCMACMIFGKT